MTVGDPKKVAVLAVVALIVCSAAVFRALPRADHVVNTLLAPAETRVSDVSVPSYPEVLTRDPFSHSALAKKATGGDQAAPTEEFHPPQLPGNLPGVDYQFNGEDGGAPGLPRPTGDPAEITGTDRNSTVETSAVSVAAILVSDRATVMLRHNGGTPMTFRVGQVAFDRVRVVKVDADSVVLRTPKSTVKLRVGETVNL